MISFRGCVAKPDRGRCAVLRKCFAPRIPSRSSSGGGGGGDVVANGHRVAPSSVHGQQREPQWHAAAADHYVAPSARPIDGEERHPRSRPADATVVEELMVSGAQNGEVGRERDHAPFRRHLNASWRRRGAETRTCGDMGAHVLASDKMTM